MIKTSELMLGNLVEYKQQYGLIMKIDTRYVDILVDKYEHSEVSYRDINPIELTDDVLNRMNGNISHFENFRYLHIWQNARTINNPESGALDITPLLAPRYTTHDGVEVWEGDEVWYTFTNPSSGATPQRFIAGVDVCNNRYVFFSTQQACQSYIDSVTRKPIFTTEDGVDVFEGDRFWFTIRSGFRGKEKYYVITNTCGVELANKHNYDYIIFSTYGLAQAYLNKVWAEKEYQSLLNAKK